ncbi:fimbrial family protein [Escherichia coli]|nr:fimbrial family protein [Escherichia coli]
MKAAIALSLLGCVFGFSGKAFAGDAWGPCTPRMARLITIMSMWMLVYLMRQKTSQERFYRMSLTGLMDKTYR